MQILRGEEFRSFWQEHRSPLIEPQREKQVREILASVRARGDQALLEYTARFDGVELTELEVGERELADAWKEVDEAVQIALRGAAANIRKYYEQSRCRAWNLMPGPGGLLGEIVRPLEKVGVYIPGGRASYPSSVLMTVIPARVAGVKGIIICTPPRSGGRVDPAVLVAAQIAGASRIFKVGGAQAIAALAYGTESIPAVDKIVGPGNTFVTLAKKLVAGEVGIDGSAGPSEVMILADESLPPAWAAADLLAQAEHDPEAAAILVTTSHPLVQTIAAEVEKQLAGLPRRDITGTALGERGALVVVSDWSQALDLVNLVAPEHLQLALKNPWALLNGVKNAGAIFLGPYATVPVGDYAAGPSHVLPTGGTARFTSYLGVEDFCKRSSLIYLDASGLAQLGDTVVALARAEGLEAHARAVLVRCRNSLEVNRDDKGETGCQ